MLDERVKIVLLFAVTIAMFAAASPWALAVWAAALAAVAYATGVAARTVLRLMRPVGIVLAFTLLANLVSCDGRADIALAGPVGLSAAGGLRGFTAVCRIFLLVGFSVCMASSASPTALSDAAVRLAKPLGVLGVPVADVGLAMMIAIRSIPLVEAEARHVQSAQAARCAPFDEGGLVERIGVWGSVLVPLVVGLFRQADRMAEAMDARCYGSGASTRLAPRSLAARDWLALVMGLAGMAAVVLVSWM